jgi:hypothetical protein
MKNEQKQQKIYKKWDMCPKMRFVQHLSFWVNDALTIPSKVCMSKKLALSMEKMDLQSCFLEAMKSGNSRAQPTQGATLMPNNTSSLWSITPLYRWNSQEIALK